MQIVSVTFLLFASQSTQAFNLMTPAIRTESLASSQKLQMSASDNIDRREALTHAAATIFATSAIVSPLPAFAKRPEYLVEPTEEFKESERQRDEFRKNQIEIKKKFVIVLDRITNTSKTEKELVQDLEELKVLIATYNGLPLGIKKDDVVKQIRAKKAKGFWPTSVEYAYQAVIREIAYQQSPNKDKDIANPL